MRSPATAAAAGPSSGRPSSVAASLGAGAALADARERTSTSTANDLTSARAGRAVLARLARLFSASLASLSVASLARSSSARRRSADRRDALRAWYDLLAPVAVAPNHAR